MVWSSFDLIRDVKVAAHGQSVLAEVLLEKGKRPTKMPRGRKASEHEQQVEKFRQDYSIPKGVDVEILVGPTTVEDTASFVDSSNLAYWLEAHCSMGLRFPLPTLIHPFFFSTNIHPTDTHANTIHLLLGMAVLSFVHYLNLGLEKIFFLYNMKRVKEGKFFFIEKKSSWQLVLSLLNTHKGDPLGNILVKGSLGCRDDPNLILYPINFSREQPCVSPLPPPLFLFCFKF